MLEPGAFDAIAGPLTARFEVTEARWSSAARHLPISPPSVRNGEMWHGLRHVRMAAAPKVESIYR